MIYSQKKANWCTMQQPATAPQCADVLVLAYLLRKTRRRIQTAMPTPTHTGTKGTFTKNKGH
jgi:hypothetical protein